MAHLKTLGNNILGFRIRDKQKIDNSILYKCDHRIGNYCGTEEVWAYAVGPGVRDINEGDCCILSDAFELESCKNMHHDIVNNPKFAKLLEEQEQTEGKIETVVFSWKSVLAIKD